MTEPYVKHTVNQNIGTIEFFHPAHNSLPSNILSKLAEIITKLGQNDEILVIVLKSGGNRTFCAGASFKELVSIENEKQGKAFFSGFANVINAIRTCPKFIIGRVQGKTVGGGVGLASSMDYCLATQYASIKLSELNLGIGPFVVGPAVERKIGVSGMSQIAIDANTFFSADWAKQKGLYADVFETTEALDKAVNKLAKELCSFNPEAVKHMKHMFWRGTEDWDELLMKRAEISGRLVLSKFTKEKLNSYRN
ncbi:enoyl-CoA hydratase/isomerase family protein [Mesohalobacter halotolerans]|uniref:Enoyl-CoA hydratase/isomerase family protein n=1 Tax=Mesohalobacter halotolerans TaxID=1883405 RepID=A0A4U5TTX3_9FLAO|nr:enoyl-CoA hydratase/isomerase family protein [Mesohalobacter halotolerans]MBS3738058.1 enoyl-CoA hydratase/isomerase family protein [Psychroflexus sp.]TKS56944.1 enoyl-CoA hydratase/isomerase family protein [Mesohalobacter halotolerans]